MLKVHISPNPDQAGSTNGIGRVVSAQYHYLPQFGIELVDSPQEADVKAAHIWSPLVDIDVLHCHGLEWTGDNPEGYHRWHSDANRAILTTARRALAVTVPSEWVAMPFRRDMRLEPVVIGHGLDLEEWQPLPQEERGNFILWNKNRSDNVCDPTPANELARRGLPVVSTFGDRSAGVEALGLLPYEQMKLLVKQAGVYLATTKETFGIGTLEALAAGVPVLGYDFGGTSDLVQHKVNGYLVKPGDIDGLVEGYKWLMESREEVSLNAGKSAEGYAWPKVIEKYADLYREVYERKKHKSKVAVVITTHNYGQYIDTAVGSAKNQTRKPDRIIVIDDGSTDGTFETAKDTADVYYAYQENQGVAAARNNGIEMANDCEYVVCLDADDWLEPHYIETLYNALEQDRALGVAYTGLMMHFPNGEAHPSNWPPEFDFDAMTVPSVPPANCVPCAAMFRREMWVRAGGYRQEYAPGEDVEFFLRGFSIGYQGKRATTAPLFNYRMHEGSASRTKKYKAIDGLHPWMRDRLYPMAAPVRKQPPVRSYSEPTVSVIIPVGPGHTKFLPRALDSLTGQTFRNWEAIVVDDTERRGVGDPFDLRTYPFVRLIRKTGEGAGYARNAGLIAAKAPLVLWLDADDWLEPDALEKMVAAYADSGGRYIYTDWIAVDAEGNTERLGTGEYNREGMFDKLQHAVTVLMSTEDARRVGGFDTALESWEDWDFFIKCAVAGICGKRLPEYLLNYRTTTGTRRKEAFKKADKLNKTIRERYKGEVTTAMAGGCCGGSADSILAAKRAAAQQAALAAAAGEPQPAGTTRLEFTGSNLAGITYRVPGGNSYVGSASPEERYIYAQDSDVDALLQLGVWRLA